MADTNRVNMNIRNFDGVKCVFCTKGFSRTQITKKHRHGITIDARVNGILQRYRGWAHSRCAQFLLNREVISPQ